MHSCNQSLHPLLLPKQEIDLDNNPGLFDDLDICTSVGPSLRRIMRSASESCPVLRQLKLNCCIPLKLFIPSDFQHGGTVREAMPRMVRRHCSRPPNFVVIA